MKESDQAGDFFDEYNSAGLSEMLPELSKAIEIFRSIPATSCSSERSFSALRRIKTYLRNRTGQDRLSNLALLNIEREYSNRVSKENIEEIIDIFGKRCGRAQYFF